MTLFGLKCMRFINNFLFVDSFSMRPKKDLCFVPIYYRYLWNSLFRLFLLFMYKRFNLILLRKKKKLDSI
jgi:hypothetical protein